MLKFLAAQQRWRRRRQQSHGHAIVRCSSAQQVAAAALNSRCFRIAKRKRRFGGGDLGFSFPRNTALPVIQ